MLQKFGLEEAPIDESDYLSGSAKSGYGGISVSFPNENDDVSSIGTNFDGANYKVRDDPEKDNHKGKSISIDAAVELIGIGRFHSIALLTTGLCFMADSMEITLLAFLSYTLKDEWGLTSTQAASISSFVFLGQLCGTLVLGKMGDLYGRRPIFLSATSIICIAGLLTALMNQYIPLLIARFFVGFGIGGLTVPYDILAELLPVSLRGNYLLLTYYYWTAGSVLVTFFAYITIGSERDNSWKVLVILHTLPCFLSVIMSYLYIPESPRWLLSQGRKKEALLILNKVAAINGEHDILSSYTTLKSEGMESAGFMELFSVSLIQSAGARMIKIDILMLLPKNSKQPKWRKLSFSLWGLWFGYGFTFYGIIIGITRVFEANITGIDQAVVSFDFPVIFMTCFAETLGVFFATQTVDRMGRIKSQVWYFALAGIGCTGMFWLPPPMQNLFYLKQFFALFARCFEIGAKSMTWITTAEILKTEIRATGHAAANAACRVGAMLTAYTVESNLSLFTIGSVMALVHTLTVLCVGMIPETSGLAIGTTMK